MLQLKSSDGSILISQSGCDVDLKLKPGLPTPGLLTQDTSSLILSGNGITVPISGKVKLSVQPNNYLIQNPDGLYITLPSFSETPLTVIDTPSVNLTASGISGHILKAEIKLSPQSGNALSLTADGLYVATVNGGSTPIDINASLPLVYNVNTGALSINQAGTISAGYLSAANWNTFNSKEPAITAGTLTQYWRGDKTWQTLNTLAVVEAGTNLYFTNARFDSRFATKTTDDLTEGSANLYATTSRIRLALSGTAPIAYNNTTGVISAAQASTSVNGFLTSTDWNVFNAKAGTGINLGSVGSQPLFKQKNGSNNLEFRAIKAGTGATVSTSGDDIIISATGVPLPPITNAGPDQTPSPGTYTVTLAGSATDADGTIASHIWVKISGPSSFTITDASSYTTTVTGLAVGNYVFRLYATDATGLTSHDDVVIGINSVPVTDTIYVGANSDGSIPDENEITSGISSTQNGALDVTANWISFNATPQYTWVAIPALGGTYLKNHWYVDTINQGNMGTIDDAFGAPVVVNVGGDDYNVWITNYATQWTSSTTKIQKV